MDFELTEEQLMVKDMARRFAETEIKPKAAELDEKHEHPVEIVKHQHQPVGQLSQFVGERARKVRVRRHLVGLQQAGRQQTGMRVGCLDCAGEVGQEDAQIAVPVIQ